MSEADTLLSVRLHGMRSENFALKQFLILRKFIHVQCILWFFVPLVNKLKK